MPYVSSREREEFEVSESKLKLSAVRLSRANESNGRVRHDDRGNAVWDWSGDSDVFNELTASAVLRRLDVAELKMQEPQRLALSVAGCDAGGGGDPYNRGGASHGSGPRRLRFR